jgi:flotillin
MQRSMRHALADQQQVLNTLIRGGQRTRYGQSVRLYQVSDYESFKSAVPVQDYEAFRPWVEQIKAGQTVGVAQAEALKAADIKVIVTGGDVPAGMNNITEVFSAKGGQALGAMLEGLAQTDAGKAVFERATKGSATPKE